jgi:hypothetical protein
MSAARNCKLVIRGEKRKNERARHNGSFALRFAAAFFGGEVKRREKIALWVQLATRERTTLAKSNKRKKRGLARSREVYLSARSDCKRRKAAAPLWAPLATRSKRLRRRPSGGATNHSHAPSMPFSVKK